jgi:hypothetical protein
MKKVEIRYPSRGAGRHEIKTQVFFVVVMMMMQQSVVADFVFPVHEI